MEPLRPGVDVWVWTLFRERRLTADHFEQSGESCLLGKPGREHFYAAFDPFARRNAGGCGVWPIVWPRVWGWAPTPNWPRPGRRPWPAICPGC